MNNSGNARFLHASTNPIAFIYGVIVIELLSMSRTEGAVGGFTPPVDCQSPDFCPVLRKCQGAVILDDELAYAQQGQTHDLAERLKDSTCSSAAEARQRAQAFLDNNLPSTP